MRKLVVVINGSSGAGKDTIVKIVAKNYFVKNVSSIDLFRIAAAGFDVNSEEQRTDRGRKLLSDLKKLLSEYNNFPTRYLISEFTKFMFSKEDIMFAHIREPDEIQRFVDAVKEEQNTPFDLANDIGIITLLIENRNDRTYGNDSDDHVHDYDYDYVYENTGKLEELDVDFMKFFDQILRRENVD